MQKTIRETLKRPSAALQAMVDGLREQSKRKDFMVNMATFGVLGDGNGIYHSPAGPDMCYGCAATCAIQQVAGVNFGPENIEQANHHLKTPFTYNEVVVFEDAIDGARSGFVTSLASFFDVKYMDLVAYNYRWEMHNLNWQDELPKVEKVIAELREKGL